MMEEAIFYADEGVPVFPLHEVYDGICTCTCTRKKCGNGKHGCGSECTNKGKHPRTAHGKDDATTDFAQIREWWKKWPRANIGGRMTGRVVLDVDPRHGGDASLHDLVEAHGSDWLETRSFVTGSLGLHLWYTCSEEMPNTAGKIAPGIDTRGHDGYVVLAPSLHESGRRYEVKDLRAEQPAPVWLIEAIKRAPDQQPATVIDFQERRVSSNAFGTRIFNEGERNDGLRDVALGRWVNGWAVDVNDLYQQVLEARDTRCTPGKTPPPSDSELYDLATRTTRKYARGALREGVGV
jgi:putative DNA primase/helicase